MFDYGPFVAGDGKSDNDVKIHTKARSGGQRAPLLLSLYFTAMKRAKSTSCFATSSPS